VVFTNYTTLQAAIAHFLNRDDLLADASIAGFISLAEATIKRRLRRTVLKDTLTFTSGSSSKALAATVAELRSIAPAVDTNNPQGAPPLSIVTMETLDALRPTMSRQGQPRYAAVINQTVHVVPAPTDKYLIFDVVSFTKLVPLTDAAPTNALLTEAPDAYLYGACLEAAPFLEHDERIPVWQARFNQVIDELNDVRQREEFGGSLKRAKLPVSFG
jgi:hypothetical protein